MKRKTLILWWKNRNRWQRLALVAAAAICLWWTGGLLTVPHKLFDQGYSALLYSSEGTLLGARIAPDGQWRFPPADSIPYKFKQCLLTYEDRRFRYHPGVDAAALMRAMRLNLRQHKIVSGGSTVTMQIARIARGNRERNLREKLIEINWALYLETVHSKNSLLKLYVSNAPFGGNTVGLDAAAWRYFGRGADELSWAENATLAVLPNSPALIHPGRNRKALKKKRDKLLRQLLDRGFIDRSEYELSCMEMLPDAPITLPDKAPHLLQRLAAITPGKRIHSSIRRSLQEQTQAIVDRYAAEYSSNYIFNAAAIIADVETGEVLAYAGNVTPNGDKSRGYSVDIITAPRSTGSILKPFLYAGMLQSGQILPGMLVADVPLNINGFTPQNFSKTFYGAVPAHTAIERSLNVPLVRMLSDYNTGRFMTLLKRCGMTTLRFSEEHYGASIILGGAEGTLWNLAGMYASMARVLNHYHRYNGRYDASDIHALTPFPAKKKRAVVNLLDKRLSDHPSALGAASIWFTFEAMSALNRPEEEADWQQFSSMKKVAWKTGTSFGGRDAWAIGCTPEYVVGVWCGNASGEGRPGLTGVGNAAPVLFDLFSLLPDGKWFDEPYDELTPMRICRQSGHRASANCTDVDTVYLPSTGVNSPVCPYHKIIHLSPDGQWRVDASCEDVDRMITRSWFVLPPSEEYYYREYHIDYRPLPPFKPGCNMQQSKQIEMIYPEHNAVLFLPRGFSGEREHFVFRAADARPEARLYWHLDRTYLGETTSPHQMSCQVAAGKHLLTLIDDEGNEKRILFVVKE